MTIHDVTSPWRAAEAWLASEIPTDDGPPTVQVLLDELATIAAIVRQLLTEHKELRS